MITQKITIREATEKDTALILDLIKELSEYEKLDQEFGLKKANSKFALLRIFRTA